MTGYIRTNIQSDEAFLFISHFTCPLFISSQGRVQNTKRKKHFLYRVSQKKWGLVFEGHFGGVKWPQIKKLEKIDPI